MDLIRSRCWMDRFCECGQITPFYDGVAFDHKKGVAIRVKCSIARCLL